MKIESAFIGRQDELRSLEKRWASPRSEFVVVYGRRRVGKTELIRRFLTGRKGLFAVGTRSTARDQVRHFMGEMALLTGDSGLASLPVADWDTAFDRLNAALEARAGKLVVVLDEFQWMAEASPELPSVMQKWWDRHWSKNGRMMLIVCGSFLGFMEREVLGQKSPLFGRRTGLMKIEPFRFEEARGFHPGASLKDQMRIYLVCGGIPAYHGLFGRGNFLPQLLDVFYRPDAPLAKEADFLLLEELREPRVYFSILENLGSGRKTVTELADALGIERSRLPYYTKSLMDLRYVDRLIPLLNYQGGSEARGVYRIADPLLRFWFALVYPYANALQYQDPRSFFQSTIVPQLDAFCGRAFEVVAADLFARGRVAHRALEPWRIGSYWDRERQIDFIVALKSGRVYAGEVKWGSLSAAVLREGVDRVRSLELGERARPVFVSMEKVPAALKKAEGVECYSVEDLLTDVAGESP